MRPARIRPAWQNPQPPTTEPGHRTGAPDKHRRVGSSGLTGLPAGSVLTGRVPARLLRFLQDSIECVALALDPGNRSVWAVLGLLGPPLPGMATTQDLEVMSPRQAPAGAPGSQVVRAGSAILRDAHSPGTSGSVLPQSCRGSAGGHPGGHSAMPHLHSCPPTAGLRHSQETEADLQVAPILRHDGYGAHRIGLPLWLVHVRGHGLHVPGP